MQGCAFDPKELDQKIIGRFSLHQILIGNEEVSLHFNNMENGAEILADGIQFAQFDSVKKTIYIKEEIGNFSDYHVFQLLDYNSLDRKMAYNETEVNDKEFKKLVDGCTDCITLYEGRGRIKNDIE